MADPHDWHKFDDRYEVCQMTETGELNQWRIRPIGSEDDGTALTDAEFDQLREEGPNPKGLS